jgi:uracil-DNA glycosylase
MQRLLTDIKNCTICEPHLPLGANPVVRAHPNAKIVIMGQAPGTRVHETSIPWNDPSGVLLRQWLQMDDAEFYGSEEIAIIPMGFCYPGKGKSGDLPPRTECAPKWHNALYAMMPDVKLTLLIGQYSQKAYLGKRFKKNLTETVRSYGDYAPDFFPLPHPSPRNRIWLKRNPWFDEDVIPALRQTIQGFRK